MSSPYPAASDLVHDMDDEKYKKAIDMMRAQRQRVPRLPSGHFGEIENSHAELKFAIATTQRQNASFVAGRIETKKGAGTAPDLQLNCCCRIFWTE